MVLPFKLNLFDKTSVKYYLFLRIYQKKIHFFGEFLFCLLLVWVKGFQKKNVYDSPHVREFRFRNSRNFCLCNPQSGKICLWNPGLWNPEYSSRNPPSHYWWESGIQVPSSSAWNPESTPCGIQNPRLSWILSMGRYNYECLTCRNWKECWVWVSVAKHAWQRW